MAQDLIEAAPPPAAAARAGAVRARVGAVEPGPGPRCCRAGDEAAAAHDAEARSTATRAAGLALKETGRSDDAVRTLGRARRVGLRAGVDGRAALAAQLAVCCRRRPQRPSPAPLCSQRPA